MLTLRWDVNKIKYEIVNMLIHKVHAGDFTLAAMCTPENFTSGHMHVVDR